jgi:hypothetical protein
MAFRDDLGAQTARAESLSEELDEFEEKVNKLEIEVSNKQIEIDGLKHDLMAVRLGSGLKAGSFIVAVLLSLALGGVSTFFAISFELERDGSFATATIPPRITQVRYGVAIDGFVTDRSDRSHYYEIRARASEMLCFEMELEDQSFLEVQSFGSERALHYLTLPVFCRRFGTGIWRFRITNYVGREGTHYHITVAPYIRQQ